MDIKLNIKHILCIAFFLIAMTDDTVLFAQSCPQNNIVVGKFELRDINGVPFSITDNYQIGQPVTGSLWVVFTTVANGYNLLMTYDIYKNGVLTQSQQTDCLFSGVQIAQNVFVRVRNVTWNWGDKFDVRNIYMTWDTGSAQAGTTCPQVQRTGNSQCFFSSGGFTAVLPLYPNFAFSSVCNFTGAVNFTNNTAGGVPPYTYKWNFGGAGSSTQTDPTTQTNPIFTFAQPGNYNVSLTATDNINTITTVTKTIFIPDIISISAVINPTQINGSTGNIDVSVTGGTAPYIYLWTYPDGSTRTTEDISLLAKGTYNLLVTDAKGCTQTAQFTVKDLLTPDFTYTPTLCNTRIQFTNTTAGGTPPFNYTYSWDFDNNGISDSNLTNPVNDFPNSGTFPITLTVSDGVSTTTITKSIFIDPNLDIVVDVFPTKDKDESGKIYVQNVTGGTAPYSYLWTGPNGFTSTDKDIFNLKDGLYQLTVTDANGCSQTEQYFLDIATVLSLEWKSFELILNEDKIKVMWEMNSDVIGTEYVIQRGDGNISAFQSIATIRCLNSSLNVVKYEFEDLKYSRFEENIYYRIQRKHGGNTDFSSVKMIKQENQNPLDTWMVFPNPSSDGVFNLKLENSNPSNGQTVMLDVYNTGNLFKKVSLSVNSGQTVKLDELFGTLPRGMIFLKIQTSERTEIFKLINKN